MEKEDQAQVESTGVRGGKKNHHALPRIDYIGESLSSKEKNGLVNFSLQDLRLQKVHRLAVHLDEAATLLAVSDRSGGFLSAEHLHGFNLVFFHFEYTLGGGITF